MRIDLRRSVRAAALVCVLLPAVGCGRGSAAFQETSGPEALRRLPDRLPELVPEDAVICLDDARQDGRYRIWILRDPGGTWMDFSKATPGGKKGVKVESHDMPPTTLLGVLRSRTPGLKPGKPKEPRCRFTHWKAPDGAEIQTRELITDHGWFASVERVAM